MNLCPDRIQNIIKHKFNDLKKQFIILKRQFKKAIVLYDI
jgi:hypothetical protein